MIAGHSRSGMLLSAISTRIIADLVLTGQSPLAIDAFDPGRFGAASVGA
jgi:glycine oxidase